MSVLVWFGFSFLWCQGSSSFERTKEESQHRAIPYHRVGSTVGKHIQYSESGPSFWAGLGDTTAPPLSLPPLRLCFRFLCIHPPLSSVWPEQVLITRALSSITLVTRQIKMDGELSGPPTAASPAPPLLVTRISKRNIGSMPCWGPFALKCQWR